MNILITGGSSEIAQAIAARRIKLGDQIIITCSTEQSLKDTIKLYQEKNLSVTGFVYSFENPEASDDAITELLKKPLDGVIFNAFTRVPKIRKLHDLKYEMIQSYIDTNIQGNLYLLHRLLSTLVQNKMGRLIFISSLSVINGTSHYGMYCAAKAALEGLFLNLAVDYSESNVLSNIVRVGIIKTERNERFWRRSNYQQTMAQIIPQGTIGEPSQVAEALDPLLSPTSFMTGSIVTVSGGLPLVRSKGVLVS